MKSKVGKSVKKTSSKTSKKHQKSVMKLDSKKSKSKAKPKSSNRKSSKSRKYKKTKKGGAIRMPSEYFGKNSGRYSSKSNHKGISFPWTDLNLSLK